MALLAVSAVAIACEPASVTDARDQLRRGGPRITSLAIPLGTDSFTIASFLPEDDTVTTDEGTVGLRFDTDSVTINVGQDLRFDDLSFDQFSYSFDEMLQTAEQSVSVAVPAPPVFGAPPVHGVSGPPTQFSTPGGSSVSGATIAAGRIIRSITNQTGCDATGVASSLSDTDGQVLAFPAINVPSSPTPVVDTILVDTIPGGVPFNASLTVDVPAPSFGACVPTPGAQVSTDVTFRPLTLSSVTLTNVNEGFVQDYSAFQSEPRIAAVDTVFVNSGSFALTIRNRLPITDTVIVRLNGITIGGQVLVDTVAVQAAPGDGSYAADGVLVFDLAGARIIPDDVLVQVTGTAKALSATITPANATDAAIVNGGGSIVIESLSGALDPVSTPELSITTESSEEFTDDQLDLGDLEDAIQASSLNYAALHIDITNTTGVPLELGLQIGVVKLDGNGDMVRLPGGAPDYEIDSNGDPILFSIADAGSTMLTIGRGATRNVAFNAAPLIDRLIDLVLDGTRTALVVAGGATAGDGQQARIARTDVIRVRFGVTIGLDITIPGAGVVFNRTQVVDGADLDPDDADEFASRLVRASAGALITNGTPFGVTVTLALTPDSLPSSGNVFAMPACDGVPQSGCRISLDSVMLPQATVNAQGQVVTRATDSVSVSLTGTQARVLLGRKVSFGIRIRLLSGTGGGRGALRPDDRVVISGRADLDVQLGGGVQ